MCGRCRTLELQCLGLQCLDLQCVVLSECHTLDPSVWAPKSDKMPSPCINSQISKHIASKTNSLALENLRNVFSRTLRYALEVTDCHEHLDQ